MTATYMMPAPTPEQYRKILAEAAPPGDLRRGARGTAARWTAGRVQEETVSLPTGPVFVLGEIQGDNGDVYTTRCQHGYKAGIGCLECAPVSAAPADDLRLGRAIARLPDVPDDTTTPDVCERSTAVPASMAALRDARGPCTCPGGAVVSHECPTHGAEVTG
jgi:hypothetical protein